MYELEIDFINKFAILRSEIDKDTLSKLKRAGAFVRRAARNSVKYARKSKKKRQQTSKPGEPPKGHVRNDRANLKSIAFDASPTEVIIGVLGLSNKRLGNGKTAAEILEKGGTQTLTGAVINGSFEAMSAKTAERLNLHRTSKTVNYARRPFMGPALQKEIKAGLVGKIWGAKK